MYLKTNDKLSILSNKLSILSDKLSVLSNKLSILSKKLSIRRPFGQRRCEILDVDDSLQTLFFPTA